MRDTKVVVNTILPTMIQNQHCMVDINAEDSQIEDTKMTIRLCMEIVVGTIITILILQLIDRIHISNLVRINNITITTNIHLCVCNGQSLRSHLHIQVINQPRIMSVDATIAMNQTTCKKTASNAGRIRGSHIHQTITTWVKGATFRWKNNQLQD